MVKSGRACSSRPEKRHKSGEQQALEMRTSTINTLLDELTGEWNCGKDSKHRVCLCAECGVLFHTEAFSQGEPGNVYNPLFLITPFFVSVT